MEREGFCGEVKMLEDRDDQWKLATKARSEFVGSRELLLDSWELFPILRDLNYLVYSPKTVDPRTFV